METLILTKYRVFRVQLKTKSQRRVKETQLKQLDENWATIELKREKSSEERVYLNLTPLRHICSRALLPNPNPYLQDSGTNPVIGTTNAGLEEHGFDNGDQHQRVEVAAGEDVQAKRSREGGNKPANVMGRSSAEA